MSRKYFDITAQCDRCGKTFTWTAKQQRVHYSSLNKRGGHGGVRCAVDCRGTSVKSINRWVKDACVLHNSKVQP